MCKHRCQLEPRPKRLQTSDLSNKLFLMKLSFLKKADFPFSNIGLRIKTWFSKIYSSLYAGAHIVLLSPTEVTLRNYLRMTNPPFSTTTDSQPVMWRGKTHSVFSVSLKNGFNFPAWPHFHTHTPLLFSSMARRRSNVRGNRSSWAAERCSQL